MNTSTGAVAPIFLTLLASLFLAQPAQARDRPGTPNGGFTGYCANELREEPAMCVEFRNTATEKVGFLMEWTENGTLMPSDLSGRSECRMYTAQAYDCRALHHWFRGRTDFQHADRFSELINPTSSGSFTADHNVIQGFRVKGLLYDSEYCFRFMTVDQFGVRSGAWSGFTCGRTPSPPGTPAAPSKPKVTGIQPTSGEGVIGSSTPFKLLVEWSGPQITQFNVGWYSIELLRNSRWVPVPSESDPNTKNFASTFEALVKDTSLGPPEQNQAVRVCSRNMLEKACSPESWYYAFMVPKASLPRDRPMARVGPAPNTTVSANPTRAQASISATVPILAPLPDLNTLAARGAELAMQDPLATELRNRTVDEALRRGFDVGFGIWEGNTAPGPGKQRVHDALSVAEQPGFDIAAAFALPRNKYAALANVGAAIGNADPALADARNAENDVFYWLGFDIASGIFGDHAAGSLGNTATGPGSLGIRNELNAAGQRGFNASTQLHLSRNYPR